MDIGKQLSLIASEMKISFTLNNKQLPFADVFSDRGLLPAIVRRADQLCSFCLGYGLGITFEDSSESRLGVLVKYDDVVPGVLRIMCATEILFELMESSPNRSIVPLDDLMYD